MRNLFAVIVFAIFTVGTAEAQRSQIKGFYIGMPKADVLRLKPTELTVREPKERERILQFQATDGGISAQFALTRGNTVRSFFLAKSYFNGSGMTTNQFFQTILDQYPVRKVMCGAVTMEAMPERFCHGLTSEGDEVKLTSERIEIIGHLRGKPPSTD